MSEPSLSTGGAPAVLDAQRLPARQLLRNLGIADASQRQALQEALGRAAISHPELAALAQGLPAFLDNVSEAYSQFHRDEAQAASEAKTRFLVNISHEIRTPMNGIIGMTALTLQTTLSQEQREYLTMVKVSADALLATINDILDFSKMEAGMMRLERSEFSLENLMRDCLKPLGVQAFARGIELVYAPHHGVPARVVGDPGRLRQVIDNLVGNAVKFTDCGEVSVSVQTVLCDFDRVRLRFCVRDTGIGIPLEKQQLVFEAFTQADISGTRRHGGTGLGLPIAANLVRLMQGDLRLRSQPGQGSEFEFDIELGAAASRASVPSPDAGADASKALQAHTVLLVDSNPLSSQVLAHWLAGWGLEVHQAKSRAEARALMLAQSHRFDAVVVDARTPEPDGFALLREFRHIPWLAPSTLVLLPADGVLAPAAVCRELGVGHQLAKPVFESELRESLRSLLERRDSARPVAAPAPPAADDGAHRCGAAQDRAQALHVLLVEDNPINQALARVLLQRRGHQVTVAAHGQQGVQLHGSQRFDLILMDLQMPVMDGIEATRAIRQREQQSARRSYTPIVAMTADAMPGVRERCIDAGMDGYVTKPVNPQFMEQEIARAMQRAMPAEPATPQQAAQPAPATVWDLQRVLRATSAPRDLVLGVTAGFLRDAPALLRDARQASARSDRARSHALIRRMGAIASALALDLLSHACLQLAPALQSRPDAGDLAATDAAVAEGFAAIETALSELAALHALACAELPVPA